MTVYENLMLRACKSLRSYEETERRLRKIISREYSTDIVSYELLCTRLTRLVRDFAPFDSPDDVVNACLQTHRDITLYAYFLDRETSPDTSFMRIHAVTYSRRICHWACKDDPKWEGYRLSCKFKNMYETA